MNRKYIYRHKGVEWKERMKFEREKGDMGSMNKKIKVLQFPIASSKGGITRYILQNWEFIDKSRFQFDFATMSKSLDYADELEKDGCKVHYISCYAEDNREQFIDEFTTMLTQGNYDVVHLHTKQWKSFLAEQIAKKVGIGKIIVHAHSSGIDVVDEKKREEEIHLHNQVVEQLTENIATDFWACSWKSAEFIFGEHIPDERTKIMPVAIDIEKYCFNLEIRNKYRKKYNLENCFVIGHVGRFDYQKNHEFLIKVFYEVLKQVSSARLLLLGDGKLMTEIKSQVRELDLEDKVIFLGKFEDICDWWYQVMDVFCLPSRFEGQPKVLVEAQASYLPCVYSDLITNEATINDNVFRIPLDVEVWKEKLIELSENRNDDIRMQHGEICLRELQDRGCDIKLEIKNVEKEYAKGIYDNH